MLLVKKYLALTYLVTLFFLPEVAKFIPFSKNTTVQIQFEHTVYNDVLKLDTAKYFNAVGQPFSITKFKYYIGNIILQNGNGTSYRHRKYYLINEEDEMSKSITLHDIPASDYTGMSITIGIDSIDNCNGVQSGALDPVHGMFWSWNSGYIFLKLEGTSAECSTPMQFFEYHIGGFTADNNCIRTTSLQFVKPAKLKTKTRLSIILETAVDKILNKPNSIDFSVLPTITDRKNAKLMADNYKDVFTVKELRYEGR